MPKAATRTARAAWSAHLRLQSEACRALAAKASEHWVAVSLTELAEEFLQRATLAEASFSGAYAYPRSRPRYRRAV